MEGRKDGKDGTVIWQSASVALVAMEFVGMKNSACKMRGCQVSAFTQHKNALDAICNVS